MKLPVEIEERVIRRLSLAIAGLGLGVTVLTGCDELGQPAPDGATSRTAEFDPDDSPDEHITAAAERATGASTWTIYRGDRGLHGVASGSLADELSLKWSFEAGAAIVSSAVVADGRVYIGCDDGNLYCLDFETGGKIWEYATEFLIEAAPLVHDGIVYVGSHDFFLHAVDAATGEGVWKFETYEKIVGSANVIPAPDGEGDWIIIGSHDAIVYALDAKTGEKKWERETNDRVNGTVAITKDGRIVFGGCDTILYSLDAATGEATEVIELGGDCNIAASVVVDGNEAYLGHNSNEVICVDLASGEIKWRYGNTRFGFYAAPALTDELLLVGGRDSRLHAIDRATGDPVWTFAARRKIDSSPTVCGDKVVVGSGDGRVYVVSIEDGSELWSYDVGKSIFSSPAIVDGRILIGCNDGKVYAFGAAATDATQEPDGN